MIVATYTHVRQLPGVLSISTAMQTPSRPMWVEIVVGSSLALRVFLHVLQFSSLHRNQHFQISNLIRNTQPHKLLALNTTMYKIQVIYVIQLHTVSSLKSVVLHESIVAHY